MKKSISGTMMRKRTERGQWERVTTIGIDLSDRFSQCCGIGDDGSIVVELRVATGAEHFTEVFRGIGPKTIAIETGTHSPWVSRLLESFGHRVIVANSRKLRFIFKNRRKDDQVDARMLARVARFDAELLSGIRHRRESTQSDLELLRARDVMVATRTRLVNHLRGAVKSFGKRLPSCSPEALPAKAAVALPPSLRAALEPLLHMVEELSGQIRDYDRAIERRARAYPETHLLRQVPGVGALTALAFVLTIDDANRFRRSRSVGAWLGLVPAKDDSGEHHPQMRISKEGDHYLRRLLVGSAQYILGRFGPDCDLRRQGLTIAARGGKNAKKRAVVAIARKLAVLLHHLWFTKTAYQPLFNAKQRSTAAA